MAALSSHYQVANCGTLPFGPKLGLRLSGSTTRSGNPALQATVSAREGEANISSAVVTLPHTEFLDNAHIKSPCTRVQFAANACPASTVIGQASAVTPLLAHPLEGPVYLRSSSHKLPDVVATLHGQIDIELDGRITSTHGRLADALRKCAGCAADEIHPEPRRRQEGTVGKRRRRRHLQRSRVRHDEDDRPERGAEGRQSSDRAALSQHGPTGIGHDTAQPAQGGVIDEPSRNDIDRDREPLRSALRTRPRRRPRLREPNPAPGR